MRRRLLLLAQIALAMIVIGFAAVAIVRQWQEVRGAALEVEARWGLIAVSALPVLAAYVLLVQSWRLLLRGWDAQLSFVDAARIWFVSNLGRYVPGRFWQIGAMGIMAQRRGIAPIAAVGSAVVSTIITTMMGFAIVFATGARVLDAMAPGATNVRLAIAVLLTMGLMLLLAPPALPRLSDWIGRLIGRPVRIPAPSARSLWLAALAAAISWALFGLAFRVFSVGLFRVLPGTLAAYIAVFVGSYLVGYLVLFAPGGILFREAAMIAGLTTLGLANLPQATLLALASRLWLTIIEVAPGILLLATGSATRSRTASSDVSP